MSTTEDPQDPSYQARIDIENAITVMVESGWTLNEIENFVESKIEELQTEEDLTPPQPGT